MTTVTEHTDARCAACGAALEPGAAFCGACGARTSAAGPVVDGPAASSAPRPDAAPAWHSAPAAPAWAADADLDELAAPVWRRLVALLVDQAVAGAAGGLATLAVLPTLRDGDTGSLLVPALVLLVLGAAQWFAEAFAGRTLGGALLGTRTVSVRTGRPAGLWAVLVRSVVQAAGVLLGGIGLYVVAGSGAWDEGPAQRGWHDKAAGTVVLRAPRLRRADAPADAGGPGPETPALPSAIRSETPTGMPPGPGAATPAVPPAAAAACSEAPTGTPPGPGAATPAVPPAAAAVRSEAPTGTPPGPGAATSAVPPAATSARSETPTGVPALATHAAPEPTPASPQERVRDDAPPSAASVVAPPTPDDAGVLLPGATSVEGLPEATIPTVPELGDLEHTRLVRRAPEGAGPVPHALALVLGSGERVVVTRPTVVGRRPAAPEASWECLTVADPGQSVSQTHLEVHPVEGGLEVLDRGSTNGTLLVDPDGGRWSLPPGRPALVGAGWTLVLGNLRVAVEAA